MRKSVCILLCLMLSACADTMKEGLPYLVGKPIQNAINYLGYPDDQRTIAGQDVYIWQQQRTSTSLKTVSVPFTGNAYGADGGVNYSGEASTVVPVTRHDSCTIRLFADKKGTVRAFDEDSNGACGHYSDALDQIIADAEKAKLPVDKSAELKKGKK